MRRIGVVSFLNSRPLVEGLRDDPRLEVRFDVPSALAEQLESGEFDAALVPVVDVLQADGRLAVLSDACIASDGETMTVRVFSQVPPHKVRKLWVDLDSHTSVALARAVWQEQFDSEPELAAFNPRSQPFDAFEAVLLIGDKVVDPRRGSFAYEVDLGGAWRQATGLPFVFAVWACRAEQRGRLICEPDSLGRILSEARDRGVQQAESIARTQGPELGWSVDAAVRYLTRCLKFRLDARGIEGANLFARRCAALGIVSIGAELRWPEELLSGSAF